MTPLTANIRVHTGHRPMIETRGLTSLLFRVAAAVALLQGIAHGTLIATYRPKHGVDELAVIDAMRAHHFDFGGASRSYWDFYLGYAIMAAFTCFVEAAILAQLPRAVQSGARITTGVAATFIAFNFVHASLGLRFFFPLPVVFDLVIATILVGALIASVPSRSAERDISAVRR
jgi:hypothetical protein